MATTKTPGIPSEIVTLADLAPTQDVRAGARQRVFGDATPLEKKERHMDTEKDQSKQSKSTDRASTDKPLRVRKDTLKDLEPEARNAQHVKGGIPPKLGT